jgi:hypothetical protein
MTADRLQGIVLRLANAVPTRYWLHWNYPAQDPWEMGVKIYTEDRRQQGTIHRQMLDLGAGWNVEDQLWIFYRTDEDGEPFRSNL